jgi:hypothetical protein
MKKKSLLFAAAALAALVGCVLFVQLKPGTAKYAWLVFGPTAKVRVLITVVGDTITLQQFAGEMPTGPKEQFKDQGQPLEVTLADADGVATYVIVKCASPALGTPRTKETPAALFVNVVVKGPIQYGQYCDIPLAADLSTAPVSHFHGPLAIGPVTVNWEVPSDLTLCRGEAGTDLRAHLGTMDAKHGCWVVVKTHERDEKCLFADGVRPFADIEFPSKNAGDPPIKRRYVLDQFC